MSNEPNKGIHSNKLNEFNKIFEDMISDAKELTKDLIGGINLTFIVGAISIVFGIQTSWANRTYISQGDIIPIILASAIIIAGTIIILRGIVLRKKYARLINSYKKLGKY
jgi:hypothetical protein